MDQNYTSKNTSVNKNRLPKVYTKYKFEYGSRVLDYGCGKYVNHIKNHMHELGCTWYGYDKYNQSDEFNKVATNMMELGFDVGVCANVLNVIDNTDTIKEIIKEIKDCCKTAIFLIYEGNKTNVGKSTKKDCWQRNETVDRYGELMVSMGYKPVINGNMIFLNEDAA